MSPRSVSFNQPSKTSGAGGRQYSPSVASTTTTKKTGATTTTNGASKKRKSRAASSVKSGPNSTTASQAHGVSKRYGTSKAKKAASVTASTRTARRSTTAVSVSSRHVPGAESAAIDPSIASDSDLSADDTPDASTQTREQESQQAALRFLIQKFTPEQNDRYDAFNRYSFSKPLVKRLANAVVSQSLGANIVTALRSMAKTFLGELVEGSVAVQREWLAARAGIVGDATTSTDKSGLSTPLLKGKQRPPVYGPDGVQVLVDETRPPLLPEHVREALRRYKGRTKALKRGAQLAGSVSSGMACGTSGGRIGRVRLR